MNNTMPETVSDLLCELIAIPSVNPMGRDVDGPIYHEAGLSDWLMGFFQSIGAPSERIEVVPGRDNVLARYDSPGANSTLLLDVHQDTVPVEGMTVPPFEAMFESGRITGRGAADVKGGMAAMLFAFRRLFRERPSGAANVVLSCTVDEEATTLGITDLVKLWTERSGRSQLLRDPPCGAIIAEPTELNIVVAHRGVTRFRIRTHGRACHSSEPSRGENAIYRMAAVVQCLEEYAASLQESVDPHPLCGGATLSVGRIEGGVSVNIVPECCVIEIDRRMIPGEDHRNVVEDIVRYVESRLDVDIEFEIPWLVSEPLDDADNAWLADGLQRQALSVAPGCRCVGVPYGTHASRTSAAGVPSVVFGPGSIAQAHTKDEFIGVDQLEQAAEIYFRVCSRPPSQRSPATHTTSQ